MTYKKTDNNVNTLKKEAVVIAASFFNVSTEISFSKESRMCISKLPRHHHLQHDNYR